MLWDPCRFRGWGWFVSVLHVLSGHLCPDHPLAFPDHVTREKLDRILALIQGSHQKALVM